MKQDYHQLLKPELIRSVSGLALIAKVIVDGYLSGLNHSRRVGSGMEFSQFRNYEAGDDLRLLDWKMLARSGRYYIKQSEIETNIAVKFVLDASGSMMHTENELSKMDYVRVLIATMAYMSQNQGDAIGLFALNDDELYSLTPKIQKQHFNQLLGTLTKIESGGKWPEKSKESNIFHDRGHKELIFFITDFYEHSNELSSFVEKLKTPRNEVMVLHVMGKNEMDFDYKGTLTFEDLETGAKRKVDTKEAKKYYLQSLKTHIAETKNNLLASNIGYHLFRLDEPIGNALQLFIKMRNRIA
ncbi:DUF58 domain-containing protein [Spongiivirga citrea]|uniref:DUF58 domain-containing protein n=1 Tax=Spongiivirga citrea TaxID=1481457 RepID=A0A6M0CG68_9FLAO|nr:DUF58 domain-containing protein [Spongiivirga citrea]NER15883.1 DUF58 domain-containing protein [Spongiivirga citrea]